MFILLLNLFLDFLEVLSHVFSINLSVIGTFFLRDSVSSSNKIYLLLGKSCSQCVDSVLDLVSVGFFASYFQLSIPDLEKHLIVLKLSFSGLDISP
jgi:hypothetical protein